MVEAAAFQLLRAELALAPPTWYTPSGQAQVYFEAVGEVAAGRVPAMQPGFALHAMEEGTS